MKLCHVTISVRNLEESLRFYQDILGLPAKRRFFSGESEIVFLGDGETEIELICRQPAADIFIGQDISLGFEVESIQQALYLAEQNGLAASALSQPNPQVKFFFVTDPNGVRIQFIENIR